MRRIEYFRPPFADHPLEQLHARLKYFGDRNRFLRRHKLDVGGQQSLRVGVALDDVKALSAAGLQVQHAELLHVPVDDGGQAADGFRRRRLADFAAFANQAHTE